MTATAYTADGTALSTVCRFVGIGSEILAANDVDLADLQWTHGAYLEPRTFAESSTLGVLCAVDNSGTEADFWNNTNTLKRLFASRRDMLTLGRTVPGDQGTVSIDVKVVEQINSRDQIGLWLFVVTAPDPFWKGAAFSAVTLHNYNPGGSAEIGDWKCTLGSSAGAVRVEQDLTGDGFDYSQAIPGTGVEVDFATGRAIEDPGGAATDVTDNLTFDKPWGILLQPAVANAFTYTGSPGTPTATGNTKWE